MSHNWGYGVESTPKSDSTYISSVTFFKLSTRSWVWERMSFHVFVCLSFFIFPLPSPPSYIPSSSHHSICVSLFCLRVSCFRADIHPAHSLLSFLTRVQIIPRKSFAKLESFDGGVKFFQKGNFGLMFKSVLNGMPVALKVPFLWLALFLFKDDVRFQVARNVVLRGS